MADIFTTIKNGFKKDFKDMIKCLKSDWRGKNNEYPDIYVIDENGNYKPKFKRVPLRTICLSSLISWLISGFVFSMLFIDWEIPFGLMLINALIFGFIVACMMFLAGIVFDAIYFFSQKYKFAQIVKNSKKNNN